MLTQDIINELYTVTAVEQQQIDQNGKNVEDVKHELAPGKRAILEMPYWNFFDHGRIAVTKSNRFSYVPAHQHLFIEMNYCYNGRSVQYIDDKLFTLHPGQLLIMDHTVQQRLSYARRQDILLNILIRDNYEIGQLLNHVSPSENLLTKFLINSEKEDFYHDNFIIFDLNKDIVAKELIENIIIKGLHNDGKNNHLLRSLMRSFILCCSDDLIVEKSTRFVDTRNDRLVQVLEYLNNHFQDISLKSLAERFGYNANYLGNAITKETGHTFKELLQMRRLNIACNMIQENSCGINQISEYVGYENHSSLFRLFKKYLGITPLEYRNRINLPRSLDREDNPLPNPYFK